MKNWQWTIKTRGKKVRASKQKPRLKALFIHSNSVYLMFFPLFFFSWPPAGVLCESHWYLDGSLSAVCLFGLVGIRRRELYRPPAQGAAALQTETTTHEGKRFWLFLQGQDCSSCVSTEKSVWLYLNFRFHPVEFGCLKQRISLIREVFV